MLRKLGRNKQYIFFKRRNVENKRFWESWLISFYTLKNFLYGSAWKGEVKVLVTQLCLTLCNPMNCSLPGSCVREILQVRILEWVAISFSRGFSQPKDQTQVGALQACSLPHEPPGKPIYVVGSILSFFQIQMQQNLLSTYYGCQTPWEITFSDIRPQRDF